VWHEQRVSVILPTYNEKDSIRQFIVDVQATGVVDEIVVVNNNAAPGTSEEVAATGAREIHESRQGYGFAIRRGLAEATGDYLIICEPDRTFFARDVFKLLAYGEDFDVVYGSRTSLQLIWRGANMGIFLRWGNWAVAKYMELLYNATTLTDVGCTLRLIRRPVALALLPSFKIGGSEFGPEMMVESLFQRCRVVQVPVNYLPRVGTSAVTGNFWKAFFLGLRMISMITLARLKRPRLLIPRAPKRELETK
jgi:glycosyltransferase involved in cell wall biosynthesis